MKKSLYLIAAAAIALFTSCAKQEMDVPQENSTDKYDVLIKVRADSPQTKGSYDGTTGQFKWAAGDQIGVHAWMTNNRDNNWPQPLDLTAGEGEVEGTFGINNFDEKTYGTVAFYPWNGYKDQGGTHLWNGNLYVRLRPEISYLNGSGNPQQMLPLAAAIEDGQTDNIQFKHLGSGIMVTIKDVPAKANKVSLTLPGKGITGEFSVSLADITAGTATITATNAGENDTVSITFNTASDKRDMSFVFPIPTLSLSGLTIGLYNSDMLMWSKSASAASATTLSKGDVLSMPEFTVPASKTINVGIISYLLNDSGFNPDNCKVHYWGGLNGEGDASLTKTEKTEQKAVGSSYWDNNLQTFTMFKAEVPVDITGFKVYDATNNRWFGADASSSTVSAYIFNYSGDKAYYE